MSTTDINEQINRILTSNIHQDVLSQIPLQLLQSPCIQKSRKNIQDLQKSNKSSISKSQFEEDLYEKAEQIFKLKTMLEAELTNINQIVDQNQKLTQANTFLTSELKKVKNELKLFKKNTEDELMKSHRELQESMLKNIYKEFGTLKKQVHSAKILKFMSTNVFEISFAPSQEKLQKKKQDKTRLISQEIKVTINSKVEHALGNFSKNANSQTDFEKQENDIIKRLQNQIDQKNCKILELSQKNIEFQEQLSKKINSITKQPLQPEKTLQQKNFNSPKIDCYSSIFLKSVASEDQNLDQTIRQCLYHSSKSIFEQLEESKYFGKIVSRKKNGKAVEQYKNGFCYQGQFSRNYRHGLGKLFYRQKLVYSGQWYEGKFNGKGLLYSWINLNVQKIQGNFKQGKLHGHGTITFKSGSKLRVCFKENEIQSQAMFLYNQNCNYPYSHPKSQLGNLIFQSKKYGSDTEIIKFKTKTNEVIQIK